MGMPKNMLPSGWICWNDIEIFTNCVGRKVWILLFLAAYILKFDCHTGAECGLGQDSTPISKTVLIAKCVTSPVAFKASCHGLERIPPADFYLPAVLSSQFLPETSSGSPIQWRPTLSWPWPFRRSLSPPPLWHPAQTWPTWDSSLLSPSASPDCLGI